MVPTPLPGSWILRPGSRKEPPPSSYLFPSFFHSSPPPTSNCRPARSPPHPGRRGSSVSPPLPTVDSRLAGFPLWLTSQPAWKTPYHILPSTTLPSLPSLGPLGTNSSAREVDPGTRIQEGPIDGTGARGGRYFFLCSNSLKSGILLQLQIKFI